MADTSSKPRPAPKPEPVRPEQPIQHQTVKHPVPPHIKKGS